MTSSCVALATGVVLLVPLIAMQFTNEVNWDETDFTVMGLFLFCAGSTFVLLSRKVSGKYRMGIGALLVVVLVFVWAELEVGIFTNLGS